MTSVRYVDWLECFLLSSAQTREASNKWTAPSETMTKLAAQSRARKQAHHSKTSIHLALDHHGPVSVAGHVIIFHRLVPSW